MDLLKKILKSENGILAVGISLLVLTTMIVTLPTITSFYSENKSDEVEWIPEMGSELEADYSANLWKKFSYVNLNGLMCNTLNQPEMNEIIKLENGHLVRLLGKASEEEMNKKVKELERVNKIFKDKKIEFLYVATPYAVSKYDPQLPEGYVEYTNSDIDYFLSKLSNVGIDYLDIRDEMNKDRINQYDMWYKTDHHWTTEGGFYTFRKIVSYFESKIGLSIDSQILDEDSYNKVVYPQWHLGSYGQRTGKYYAGVDDFVLYEPKFDTCFGDENEQFIDVMYNYEPLENKNNESRYTYDFVLEKSLGYDINNGAFNNKKAAVICDSMGKSVVPFLKLAFKEVTSCDASTLSNEFLKDYNPDVVITILFPHHLDNGSEEYYCFDNLK